MNRAKAPVYDAQALRSTGGVFAACDCTIDTLLRTAVISASTNLINWTPLATNPISIGSILFTDTVATNYPRRFYRANLQ